MIKLPSWGYILERHLVYWKCLLDAAAKDALFPPLDTPTEHKLLSKWIYYSSESSQLSFL